MKRFQTTLLALCAVAVSCPSGAAVRPQENDLPGYRVKTLGAGGWRDAGSMRFRMRYEQKEMALGALRKSGDGYAIRISHLPVGMANLDDIRLTDGLREIPPQRIFDVADGTDLLKKLAARDSDVISAQGREIEAWFPAAVGEAGLSLRVVGREEDPSFIPGGPCSYPGPGSDMFRTGRTYAYVLGANPGAPAADGQLTGDDEWGRPVFSEWTEPVSGHPDGYTYGYLKDDGRHLYGALDYTSDNTYDGLDDFGAVLVKTDEGWKRFQVSVGRERWGIHGFVYTDKSAYQHKIYEFKIPLSELGTSAKTGRRLDVAFQAYGTSACPANVDVTVGPENTAAADVFLGDDDLEIVLLQVETFAAEANALLDTVTITGDGTGDEAADVAEVRIYKEPSPGHNGQVDGGDTLIGTGTFSADDGTALIDLTEDSYNCRGVSDNFLVTYLVRSTAATSSTFRARILQNTQFTTEADNFAANGCAPGNISYVGAPLSGNFKNIQYATLTASVGPNSPAAGDLVAAAENVPMLQIALAAGNAESQSIQSVRITGSGTGNETSQIAAVKLWADADGNGTVSAGDTQMGTSQTFSADDGTATFTLDPVVALAAEASARYLVTYNLATAAAVSPGAFRFLERVASRIRVRPQFLVPWTYPLVLTGCGGGEGGRVVALTGAPAGTMFTDADGNPIAAAETGSIVQLRTTDGLPILQFTAGEIAVSLDGASLERDGAATLVALGSGAAAVVLDSSKTAVSGLPDTIDVFVPCDADDNEVRICPEESAHSDGLSACAGEIRLSSGSATEGGYTWSNTDRSGVSDCRVSGEPALFEAFLGTGVTVRTFQASVAASSDLAVTGDTSERTVVPAGLPLSGAQKSLVGP